MVDPQQSRFAPAEVELELPIGTFLFRLPPPAIAKIQEARGMRVTYPDGSSGVRPKPIGAIIREHLAGVNGTVLELAADLYMAEFDAADTREVIVQGFIWGGGGVVDGVRVDLDEMAARRLVIDKVDPWPLVEKWKLATSILVTCAQGFVPPKPPGEGEDVGNGPAA